MKHSPYPYAPLLPVSVVSMYELAAIDYGMEVAFVKGQRTPKVEQLAERMTALSSRVRADAVTIESEMRENALGRLVRGRPVAVTA